MKTIRVFVVMVLGFSIAFAISPSTAFAAETRNSSRPKIYDESADGSKQIAEALALAKKENKNVLIQFGGNWCGWCIKLHGLFETNKVISDVLRTNYVLVLIDCNDRTKPLVSKYKAQELGLPSLVVLGSDGKHLTTKNTEELEQGNHHDPEKVLAFLLKWSPGNVKTVSISNSVGEFLALPGPASQPNSERPPGLQLSAAAMNSQP